MPKVIVSHGVADVAAWLGFRDERHAAICGLGGTNIVEHVAHDGSGSASVSADVDDVDAFVAALQSPPPEVAEVMQQHGVRPPLTVYVEA